MKTCTRLSTISCRHSPSDIYIRLAVLFSMSLLSSVEFSFILFSWTIAGNQKQVKPCETSLTFVSYKFVDVLNDIVSFVNHYSYFQSCTRYKLYFDGKCHGFNEFSIRNRSTLSIKKTDIPSILPSFLSRTSKRFTKTFTRKENNSGD